MEKAALINFSLSAIAAISVKCPSEEEMAREIVLSVFKVTVGLLIDKGRDCLAEKLKEGDVTDEKFRDWVIREINAMNLNWMQSLGRTLEQA